MRLENFSFSVEASMSSLRPSEFLSLSVASSVSTMYWERPFSYALNRVSRSLRGVSAKLFLMWYGLQHSL